MKILFVTGIFPPDHGGPASYVPKIANALARDGHDIAGVITLSDTLTHDDTGYGFPVIRLWRGQRYLLRWCRTVGTIRRLARHADVVYLNGLVLEGIVATKILSRRPAVIKVVGDLIWERARNQKATGLDLEAFQTAPLPWKWRGLRLLQHWYTGRADAVLTPSAYLAKIVQGWNVAGDTIKVVYNAVEIPASVDDRTPSFELVTVARLVPWKGLHDLIDVAGAKGWSLRIVGDGPLRAELEERAKPFGARVSFAGHVPSEQVTDEIRTARLLVLYSDYEGLPHIVLEAKAAGVAVLASAVGGTPETIEHGVDGWLIPPANPAALTEAVTLLLRDGNLRARLAEQGKNSVNQQCSFERMVAETTKVLSNAAL